MAITYDMVVDAGEAGIEEGDFTFKHDGYDDQIFLTLNLFKSNDLETYAGRTLMDKLLGKEGVEFEYTEEVDFPEMHHSIMANWDQFDKLYKVAQEYARIAGSGDYQGFIDTTKKSIDGNLDSLL